MPVSSPGRRQQRAAPRRRSVEAHAMAYRRLPGHMTSAQGHDEGAASLPDMLSGGARRQRDDDVRPRASSRSRVKPCRAV